MIIFLLRYSELQFLSLLLSFYNHSILVETFRSFSLRLLWFCDEEEHPHQDGPSKAVKGANAGV